jgi:hypothetical protein
MSEQLKQDNYFIILQCKELNEQIKIINNLIIRLKNKINVKTNKKQSLTLELETINLKSRLEKEQKQKEKLEQQLLYLYNLYKSKIEENIKNINSKDFKEFINKYEFEPEQKLKASLKQLYNHFKQYDTLKTSYKKFKSMMDDLKLFTTNKTRVDRATYFGIKLKT